MDLTLTWDLFIIVFFAIVITYTFIIGKKESVKIIISSYIGIVAVQGLGNVLLRLTGYVNPLIESFGFTLDAQVLSWVKLVMFVAVIILLAVKAGFDITYTKEMHSVINAVMTGVFGFATAGLMLSTLLVYVSGVPLLQFSLPETASLSPVIQQSQLMQLMILHQDLWFALPAITLIVAGFVHKEKK